MVVGGDQEVRGDRQALDCGGAEWQVSGVREMKDSRWEGDGGTEGVAGMTGLRCGLQDAHSPINRRT